MGKATDSVATTTNGATGVANAFTASQWNPMDQQMMGKALTSLLSGRPGDPLSLQQYFTQGAGSNGGAAVPTANAGFTPGAVSGVYAPPIQQVNTQVSNPFSAPQYQQTAIQRPGAVQYNAPQLQQANLQGVQTGFQAAPVAQLPNMQPGMVGREQLNSGNFGNVVNPDAQRAAMQAIMQDQQSMDVANLRERFGNQAMSTGAMDAEARYRAQAAPQMALALDEITRQNNAQALTQRGQNMDFTNAFNQLGVTQRGQDIQQNQGGAGLSLEAQKANQQSAIAQMNANLQAMGMSNEAILALNQQMLGQAGQNNQFNQQNAMNQMNAAGMNNDALLAFNQQMQQGGNAFNQFQQNNAQFGAQMGQNAQQQSIQNALQQMGLNMQNNQFGANFQQNAQQLNNQFGLDQAKLNQANQFQNIEAALQNQGLMNQFALGMQGIGAQREGNQQQAMIAALAQMMQNLRQTQALGTPQAENIVKGGWLKDVGGIFQGVGDMIPG